MPVDPTFGIFHAAATADIVQTAEARMIRMIADELRFGILTPDGIDRVEVLARTNVMRQALGMEIADLRHRVDKSVWDAIQTVYTEAQEAALQDLATARIEWVLPPVKEAALRLLATEIVDTLDGFYPTILRSVNDAYLETVQALIGDMTIGGLTRAEAAQHVLNRFADKGITGFIDKAGRNWTANAYAEMALRTGYAHVATVAHMEVLTHNGIDLVIVSEAPRPCPLCAPYEGKVLSITGATATGVHMLPSATDINGMVPVTVTATVDDARENGLHHPNCRHALNMYQPGITYDHHPVSDPEQYAAGQEQRRLERHVRKWRRREAAAVMSWASADAATRADYWLNRLETHLDTHPYLKRQSAREQVARAY